MSDICNSKHLLFQGFKYFDYKIYIYIYKKLETSFFRIINFF